MSERLARVVAPLRDDDPLRLATYGEADWERLLLAAREETQATCAFVIDGRGLLVASAGDPPPEAERLGLAVLASLDEADRIRLPDCEAESLTLGGGERWTTGIRVRRAGPDSLVLVLVGPCAVQDRALLGTLRRTFARLGEARAPRA